ncbi:VWA domain-containing protein [Bosea sp. 117]|uniref:VWA domain-containing protein n=1 Tax=Bosea sp. 117 TaxID=1125973 RepID=UPI000493D879|nr:VWA domain-containing protein [Bosea sp. 117]
MPVAAAPVGAELGRLMRGREALRASFVQTWQVLSRRHDPAALEPWAAGTLELVNVNAGASCLLAFWRASIELSTRHSPASLGMAARAAADICRHAGARAATEMLDIYPRLDGRLATPDERSAWWRILVGLARAAPECVSLAAASAERLLAAGGPDSFETFVMTGLKVGTDRAKRLRFFSLEDPLAQRLVERAGGGPGFAELEQGLKRFLTALWAGSAHFQPNLQPLPTPAGNEVSRRTNIAGPVIRLPDIFAGVNGDAARSLFRAAAAHAAAHLALGAPRFAIGKVKPVQMACIGLIEDARIETRAMRRFPGLRRLWAPYHVAEPVPEPLASLLLARVARGLFDPGYQDPDALIDKARNLFRDASPRIEDPAISFDIGTRLANDIAQRRIRFDARGYLVEPIYRDDGLCLWDFGDQDAERIEEVDLAIDAARIERRETDEAPEADEPEQSPSSGRARPKAADERGIVLGLYPEWDATAGIERPDWTTVRSVAPAAGDVREFTRALERAGALRARIGRLVRAAKVGRATRLKRQAEGHALDIDAAIDAAVSRHAGETPDERVFISSARHQRDLAVLVLIDTSESTRDRLASGASILDIEKIAVAMLAEAMAGLGDDFALVAFSSAGREDVRLTHLKRFEVGYGQAEASCLAGLQPGFSTRLGTALRHAGTEIAAVRSFRKLILVLTDGEPSDIDVENPDDLAQDARRAVLSLHARGIDTFGVTLDPRSVGSGAKIFGKANAMPVRRIEDLPMRLSELYFRLSRR